MTERTHSEPVAVNLLVGKPTRIGRFVVGQPLPNDERWLVVLGFSVGDGATDLIAHLVVPKPGGWRQSDDDLSERQWLNTLAEAFGIGSAPGRLTTALVRSATTTALERWARGYIAQLEEWHLMAPGTAGRRGARPRGPVGRRESRLVRMAARYVELYQDPAVTNPVATLAAESGLARNTVQSYLFQARHDYGLLTVRSRGVAGGALTAKGKALLATIDTEATQ